VPTVPALVFLSPTIDFSNSRGPRTTFPPEFLVHWTYQGPCFLSSTYQRSSNLADCLSVGPDLALDTPFLFLSLVYSIGYPKLPPVPTFLDWSHFLDFLFLSTTPTLPQKFLVVWSSPSLPSLHVVVVPVTHLPSSALQVLLPLLLVHQGLSAGLIGREPCILTPAPSVSHRSSTLSDAVTGSIASETNQGRSVVVSPCFWSL
jgi:hypothetical protein